MSLLTTLIPAYKKTYLGEVFLGLARQSFKDFQVIVSDDSPDGEITRLMRDGHFGAALKALRVTVVPGPRNARRNHEQLLDLWGGQTPLVHLHLDDDIIFPDFYRTHVEAHAQGGYCASVTPRWLSHADGRPGWTLPLPDMLTTARERLVVVDHAALVQTTVPHCQNWAGELSNMVLSAQGALAYPRPPQAGLSYYGLLDIGTLLEASQTLPLAFVRDHQSVFRQHPDQTTHNTRSHGARIAHLCWLAYALHAWQQGQIQASQAVKAISMAAQRSLQGLGGDPLLEDLMALLENHGQSLESLHAAFTPFWLGLMASHPSTASPALAMA